MLFFLTSQKIPLKGKKYENLSFPSHPYTNHVGQNWINGTELRSKPRRFKFVDVFDGRRHYKLILYQCIIKLKVCSGLPYNVTSR